MAAPCEFIDAVAAKAYDGVNLLNKKFQQLQRLASLIEQAGDVGGFLPDISGLIPVTDIDLSAYTNLAAACPGLNLPAFSSGNLAELQAEVLAAYGRMVSDIVNHPYLRMDSLQEEMTKVQAEINDALGVGLQWLECLQAACNLGEAAIKFSAGMNAASIQQAITDYTERFITKNGQILTDAAKAKVDNAKSIKNTIEGLMGL